MSVSAEAINQRARSRLCRWFGPVGFELSVAGRKVNDETAVLAGGGGGLKEVGMVGRRLAKKTGGRDRWTVEEVFGEGLSGVGFGRVARRRTRENRNPFLIDNFFQSFIFFRCARARWLRRSTGVFVSHEQHEHTRAP